MSARWTFHAPGQLAALVIADRLARRYGGRPSAWLGARSTVEAIVLDYAVLTVAEEAEVNLLERMRVAKTGVQPVIVVGS